MVQASRGRSFSWIGWRVGTRGYLRPFENINWQEVIGGPKLDQIKHAHSNFDGFQNVRQSNRIAVEKERWRRDVQRASDHSQGPASKTSVERYHDVYPASLFLLRSFQPRVPRTWQAWHPWAVSRDICWRHVLNRHLLLVYHRQLLRTRWTNNKQKNRYSLSTKQLPTRLSLLCTKPDSLGHLGHRQRRRVLLRAQDAPFHIDCPPLRLLQPHHEQYSSPVEKDNRYPPNQEHQIPDVTDRQFLSCFACSGLRLYSDWPLGRLPRPGDRRISLLCEGVGQHWEGSFSCRGIDGIVSALAYLFHRHLFHDNDGNYGRVWRHGCNDFLGEVFRLLMRVYWHLYLFYRVQRNNTVGAL